MKTGSILFTTLCTLMLSMGFAACSEEEDLEEPTIDPVAQQRAYILNEGHWGANNAEISLLYQLEGSRLVEANYYEKMNGKKLGDVANALMEEDENLYVLLNGSKYVARLDKNTMEQARYTFPESEGEPRCMEVEDDYVYVTQYGGQVSKLRAQDMTLAGTFRGGDNLEGVVEKDGKLYVANSYKQDGSGNFVYNKEVFVINASDMTLEKTLTVVDNPTKMVEIDDRIYLLSKGNYADIEPALQIIDPTKGTVKSLTNADKITEGNDGLIYGVRMVYDANWTPNNSFFTYDAATGVVSESSFLQDAPASFSTTAIYLLEVDEETGCIYVGTSDYVNTGTIYQFDKQGKLLHQFDSGGINPSALVFMDK